jgi:hypothetical protein
MSTPDIDKAYISPYDKFLYTFDANHTPSASQQKEIKKHQRIAKLRDQATPNTSDDKHWDGF